MKMMTIKTDEPNALGEYFRNEFYTQYEGDRYLGRGGYSSVELQLDVTTHDKEKRGEQEDGWEELWSVYSKYIEGEHVIMKLYWDGDGTMEFHFDDGNTLINTDCKKDYTWEWYEIYD